MIGRQVGNKRLGDGEIGIKDMDEELQNGIFQMEPTVIKLIS